MKDCLIEEKKRRSLFAYCLIDKYLHGSRTVISLSRTQQLLHRVLGHFTRFTVFIIKIKFTFLNHEDTFIALYLLTPQMFFFFLNKSFQGKTKSIQHCHKKRNI